jgi:hypothetical protein
MPAKGTRKPRKNNQLNFTLPAGALCLLDQLVALKVVGDGYSGVIAFLVETQLQAMKRDYDLKLPKPHPDHPTVTTPGAANSPSMPAKRGASKRTR